MANYSQSPLNNGEECLIEESEESDESSQIRYPVIHDCASNQDIDLIQIDDELREMLLEDFRKSVEDGETEEDAE